MLGSAAAIVIAALPAISTAQNDARTCFQTGSPYRPELDLGADAAIVYGFGSNMPERVKSWRDKGYRVQLMTGVAWGEYQDYLYGRFDGKNHEDEAQTDRDGNRISHGGDVYYMSPGPSYGKYLARGVRKALAANVDAVYLEEPEFWVRAGYEPAFKREWRQFYGEDWQPPDSSPDAQWRASKLKYMLYRRALQGVFDDIGTYNREKGTNVKCYVATHSLLNYASWRIVSPESSLAKLSGCDGYVAQVWTGTARTPNYYQGELKERTFETAFLEYGAMMNVARATAKRMIFLADPVEDDPKHDWGDYRRNYESTLTASLLQPDVAHYEVMPWPERVFGGLYPSEGDPSRKALIPAQYATELLTIIQALGTMADQKTISWDCGTQGIGVVVSDSLMFERAGPSPSDPELSQVYGLALPFLMHGMPVQPVQLETATARDLSRFKLLLMTYRGMKALTEEADLNIANWVRKGGVLLFVDDDGDPFNSVREWWNTAPFHFATPRQHLFAELGVEDKPGTHPTGKGAVSFLKLDPSELARSKDGDSVLLETAKVAAKGRIELKGTSWLALRRGRYMIAAGLSGGQSHTIKGRFVNLFDPDLRLLNDPSVGPGQRLFLLDVGRQTRDRFELLSAAFHAKVNASSRSGLSLRVEGIQGTEGVALLRCLSEPSLVTLDGTRVVDAKYDRARRLLWVRFSNEAKPRLLEVKA